MCKHDGLSTKDIEKIAVDFSEFVIEVGKLDKLEAEDADVNIKVAEFIESGFTSLIDPEILKQRIEKIFNITYLIIDRSVPEIIDQIESVLENLKKFTSILSSYQHAENGLRKKNFLEKTLNLNCLFSILTDLLDCAKAIKLQIDPKEAEILIEFDKFTDQNCNDDGIFVFTYNLIIVSSNLKIDFQVIESAVKALEKTWQGKKNLLMKNSL